MLTPAYTTNFYHCAPSYMYNNWYTALYSDNGHGSGSARQTLVAHGVQVDVQSKELMDLLSSTTEYPTGSRETVDEVKLH